MSTACWREIGVWGDRSCPQLLPHVHCTNCPVFVGEARGLLDRPIDAAYLDWLTQAVAARTDDAAPPDREVLVFEAGGERFAFDAAGVRVVAPSTVVRRLPHRADPAFLGLVAVRGELMPCVSLATLLGLSDVAPSTPRLLVVVTDRESVTALGVDLARGVEGIRRADTRPAPDTIRATLLPVTDGLHLIAGVETTVLDPDALAARLREALG